MLSDIAGPGIVGRERVIDPPEGVELDRDVFGAALQVVVDIVGVHAHIARGARHKLGQAISADRTFSRWIERAFLLDQRLEERAPLKGGEPDLAHARAVLEGHRGLDDALLDPGARLAEEQGGRIRSLGGARVCGSGVGLEHRACLHGGEDLRRAGDLAGDRLHLGKGFLALEDNPVRFAEFFELGRVIPRLLRHHPDVFSDLGRVDDGDPARVGADRRQEQRDTDYFDACPTHQTASSLIGVKLQSGFTLTAATWHGDLSSLCGAQALTAKRLSKAMPRKMQFQLRAEDVMGMHSSKTRGPRASRDRPAVLRQRRRRGSSTLVRAQRDRHRA